MQSHVISVEYITKDHIVLHTISFKLKMASVTLHGYSYLL